MDLSPKSDRRVRTGCEHFPPNLQDIFELLICPLVFVQGIMLRGQQKYQPGDSIRGLFIPYLEVMIRL